MEADKNKVKPFSVHAALQLRFGATGMANEWVLLHEVAAKTGGGRRADAIAVNMYRSRGHEIHGVEIKHSRNDWLKELKEPAKSDPYFKFCDRFWLAISDESICKKEELPRGWGLLVPRGDQFVARIKAPLLRPKPVTRIFMASLLRCAAKQLPPKRVESPEELEAASSWQRGYEEGKKARDFEVQGLKDGYQRLKDSIDAFEKASGVCIQAYDGENIGKVVRVLRHRDRGARLLEDIERQHNIFSYSADNLKEMMRVLGEFLEQTAEPEEKELPLEEENAEPLIPIINLEDRPIDPPDFPDLQGPVRDDEK